MSIFSYNTTENFSLQTPPLAVKPKNLWWKVFKTGTFTANNGTTKKFTSDALAKIAENTKKYISENNFPTINTDHFHNGESLGQIDDIDFDGEFLKVKVAYLTPEAEKDVKEGKYIRVSSELENNTFTGLALLGAAQPAVDGLGNIEYNFSKDDNKDFFEFNFENNEEAIMPILEKNIKKNEVKETERTNSELDFKKSDEYKKFLEYKEKALKLEQEKKELEAYKQQSENELKAFKTEFSEMKNKIDEAQKELEKKDMLAFAEKNKLPGYASDEIVEMLFNLKHSKATDVMEFKQGDDVKKIDAFSMMTDIIKRYSSTLDKFREDVVDVDTDVSSGGLKYTAKIDNGGRFVDNSDDINDYIMKFSKENKISFNEAYEKLINENLI